MAIEIYHDVVLVADDVTTGDGGQPETFTVHVFDSPVGQGEQRERVTVPPELDRRIRQLERRALDADPDLQYDLGEMLAALLLPPYARQLFDASLKRLRDGEGLRLRLRLDDRLADIPWEYAYVPDAHGERTPSGFLALDPRISIARHEALATPADWFEAPASRRIVIAMASPGPHDRYPELTQLPQEQAQIKAALAGVPGVQAVFVPDYGTPDATGALTTRSGATLRDLATALMQLADVFHFSGHGEFSSDLGPALFSRVGSGSLVLADADNQAVPYDVVRIGELLKGKGIRLVVLGACESGRRDGHNVWSGVAAGLLKAGIPAVVAMQFTVRDHLAATFMATFYQALVAGLTVDEAVSAGRIVMRAAMSDSERHLRDWGVPVLYLRAPGGRVFNPVSDEDARRQAEEQTRHLVEQQVREVGSTGRMVGADLPRLPAEPIEIAQRVDERLDGIVIGAKVIDMKGGRLTVRQKADVVTGTMIGLQLGSWPPAAGGGDDEEQALAELDRLLRAPAGQS